MNVDEATAVFLLSTDRTQYRRIGTRLIHWYQIQCNASTKATVRVPVKVDQTKMATRCSTTRYIMDTALARGR